MLDHPVLALSPREVEDAVRVVPLQVGPVYLRGHWHHRCCNLVGES